MSESPTKPGTPKAKGAALERENAELRAALAEMHAQLDALKRELAVAQGDAQQLAAQKNLALAQRDVLRDTREAVEREGKKKKGP